MDLLRVGAKSGVEEELLPGLSFEDCRKRAVYHTAHGKGGRTGKHPITENNLETVLGRDRIVTQETTDSEAALSPLEDLK